MMSIVKAASAPEYPANIEIVISNRPGAAGLAWADEQGIATDVIDHKAYPTREAFEDELHALLEQHQIDIVCLAGFMRLLTVGFVERWTGRMLNIHPSLLPAFRGLNTHQQAIDAGVRIAGCTVHFVVPEMDAGPIIAQAAVPVVDGDTAESLADRILMVEHKAYPNALALVARHYLASPDYSAPSSIPVNQVEHLFSPPMLQTD